MNGVVHNRTVKVEALHCSRAVPAFMVLTEPESPPSVPIEDLISSTSTSTHSSLVILLIAPTFLSQIRKEFNKGRSAFKNGQAMWCIYSIIAESWNDERCALDRAIDCHSFS
jgi:hypothetical protein